MKANKEIINIASRGLGGIFKKKEIFNDFKYRF